jgi:hypothetical protein
MTLSEHYTTQFYTWEYRGRGWLHYEHPVHLEPPFIPFYRHGYKETQIDDGKRPTILNKIFDSFNTPKAPIVIDREQLDYETIEPYPYDDDTFLEAIQLKLPKDRKGLAERMKAVLVMLSYSYTIFSFEVIGTEKEIILQFVCDEHYTDTLRTYLSAYFPSGTQVYSDHYINHILQQDSATMVVDFGLAYECVRPINTGKQGAFDPLQSFYTVLEQIGEGAQAGMQILFQPTCNQWGESMRRSVTMYDKSSFFVDVPEAPQLAQEKTQSLLYAVTIRAYAQSETLEDAALILQKLNHAIISASKSSYNHLIPLIHEGYDVNQRIDDILFRQSHRLGMLLNSDELTTLLHIPSESIQSKKLYASSRTTKATPAIALGHDCILGTNTHAGNTTNVSLRLEDRLKHTHIIGATGTGKSTLIANLILQDIRAGHAVILFDPHGDLVDTVCAHLPEERMNDVVLIDPSDIEFPVGINMLEAHSDTEKEVLSSDLVASFRKFATSWGDQMNSVLGNAIIALLESPQGGTLHDLRRFLIEADFRKKIINTITDPSIKYYWLKEYPLLKTNSTGPIITRLDTFLRPKSIRNMVIQKKGLDMEALCNSNKSILCKLSQGLIGAENSYLLGSLLLSTIHQALMRRQQQTNRPPVFIYLDEFQHFIMPSVKEMISGIRKYQTGLILSHQDLQQLQREDSELTNTILGNINTRIIFRVGEPDAKRLEDSVSSFSHTDLQNLGRGEAIVRIEQPQYDCSLDTLPLEDITEEDKQERIAQIRIASRSRYATPKQEVEDAFFATLDLDTEEPAPKQKRQAEQKPQSEPTPAPPKTETEPTPVAEPQPTPNKPKAPQPPPVEEQQDDVPKRDTHTHRYLQTLVKKMAEERGYTGTIEQQLPDGSGIVDVLLTKDNTTIAVEICITTDAAWEAHNIEKCIKAGYGIVISLCTDIKQLEKIRKKCMETIRTMNEAAVHFYTPDTFFAFLDTAEQQHTAPPPTETVMKGYRVNVSYDTLSPDEAEQKRKSVAKVVLDSLRKQKKKE